MNKLSDGTDRAKIREGLAAAWPVCLGYLPIGLSLGGLSFWTECREHPWRGGVGIAAAAGPLGLAAQVDTHPVLDPTARVAITLRSRGRAP